MSSDDSKLSNSVPPAIESCAYSTYKKEMFRHTWIIDMFSKRLETAKNNDVLKSNYFGGSNNDYCFVKLKYRSESDDEGPIDHVSLYLCNSQLNPIEVEFNVYILTVTNQKGTNKSFNYKLDTNWGWSKYLICSVLLENKDYYLPNDQLTIVFELKIVTELTISSQHVSAGVKSEYIKSPISFKKLIDTSKYSDFSIEIGNETLKVHKSILAAQSAVFEAMFDVDMIEKQKNSVVIDDIDYDVMKAALDFIYTGECPKLNEIAVKLLELAEKYEFKDLNNACEDELCSTMSVKNAAHYLIAADRYNATKLKTAAINYIKDHIKLIIHLNEWKMIKMPDYLFKDIIMATNSEPED